MRAIIVPTLTCPVCKAKLRAVNTRGPAVSMAPGDWLVCMVCGSILRYMGQLGLDHPYGMLVEVTEEEIHPLRMAEYQQMKAEYRRKKAKLN